MLKPPIPANESRRLQALQALEIPDTPAEERFDRLTRIAQHILQVPIVLISLVDAERQWFKSRQGLSASETPRDISFCGHAILGAEVFVVPDAAADPRFADNPLVREAPDIRFYAGAPLTLSNGQNVGTLCAIDRKPRQVSEGQLAALRDLAQCVSEELELYTKLRRVEQLTLVQAKLASIVESSEDAIISKTLDGIITSWNPAAEKLFGYSAQEAIGQPMAMLIPADRADEESMILARIQRGERVERFATLRIRKDGQPLNVSVRISPLRDGDGRIIGASKSVHDISGRLQTEAALEKSAQLVKSIVETVEDGIITIDAQGTVLSFNAAAKRIFGYAQAEIIGTNVKRLMPKPYAADHDGYIARYLETNEAHVIGIGREVVGQRKDGSSFPMEIAVNEMRQPGQTLFVGVVGDITERKEVDRLKAEFVSTVSHELRTPLTSIRGALGLLVGNFADGLPDTVKQLLETANRNSERLTLL
ncbi:MAG: PAS domain S-box protein, partial [Proteobacteria bacterium]|nr:PAS domain S-box protein [Pseudomonadota bacterium]